MTAKIRCRPPWPIGAILLAAGFQAQAAVHFVGVDDRGFLPAMLNIDAGDTVVWVNTDDFFSHTTTSDLQFPHPDAWHAVLVDEGETFAKVFNNSGNFTYRDLADFGTGTVIVGGSISSITLESLGDQDGQFIFGASGLTVGRQTVLEFSTNLIHWAALVTNLADNNTMLFTNGIHPGARFFRVQQLP